MAQVVVLVDNSDRRITQHPLEGEGHGVQLVSEQVLRLLLNDQQYL